jgi:hypothetical protein
MFCDESGRSRWWYSEEVTWVIGGRRCCEEGEDEADIMRGNTATGSSMAAIFILSDF